MNISRSKVKMLTPAQMQNLFPPGVAPSERWIARKAKEYGIATEIDGKLYVADNFIQVHWVGGVRDDGKYPDLSFPKMPGTYSVPGGWVYFIRSPCGRYVKIGRATNVLERLKRLQVGHYGKLELIFALEGSQPLEEELHQRFEAQRSSGEWFRWAPEIRDFVRNKQADRKP